MATGITALGTAAVGAAGDAASGSNSAAAMAAPLSTELDQTVTFGGARKNPNVTPVTAIIFSVAIVSAVTIYALTRK